MKESPIAAALLLLAAAQAGLAAGCSSAPPKVTPSTMGDGYSRDAHYLFMQAKYKEALAKYSEALMEFYKVDSLPDIARVSSNIAVCLSRLGRHEDAVDYANLAAETYLTIGEKSNYARCLANMGSIHLAMKKPYDAKPLYEESLKIIESQGRPENSPDKARVLAGLSFIRAGDGNLVEAKKQAEHARSIFEKTGDKAGVASTNLALAHIARLGGDLKGARALAIKSLEADKENQNPPGVLAALRELASIEEKSDKAAARVYLLRALDVAKALELEAAVRELKDAIEHLGY